MKSKRESTKEKTTFLKLKSHYKESSYKSATLFIPFISFLTNKKQDQQRFVILRQNILLF